MASIQEGTIMRENEIPEITINHAILHILDFTTRLNVLSQQELSLNEDQIYGYVFQHIFRTINDTRLSDGVFEADSDMLHAIRDYRAGRTGFIDLSDGIAQRFIDIFTEHPDLQAFDLLIADYSIDLRPCCAILVLENTQAWSHQVDSSTGILINELVTHHAVLPSPTRKIKTYALIDISSEKVQFTDEMKTQVDQKPKILKQVLGCTEEKSSEEVIRILKNIAVEVAEEHEEDPAAVLSVVKTQLKKNAEETESFSPKDIAEDFYRDAPVLQQAFRQKLEETPLPATVSLPVKTAVRVAGKQKIKTDTGIEISVPAELFSDPDCIEFTKEVNGTTTITIKGIHKISSRS